MLATISNATYDASTGTIVVTLDNSIANGFQNQVDQYQTANTLSVPIPGNVTNLDIQSSAQMQVSGYKNRITDTNYSIAPGEFTSYSPNWYSSTRVAGIEAQQVNTANKENFMMGQSTNGVLTDIMTLLIGMLTWMETHTHLYSPGSNTPVQTNPPTQTPPNDSDVTSDQSYIADNKNLAITGTYMPH